MKWLFAIVAIAIVCLIVWQLVKAKSATPKYTAKTDDQIEREQAQDARVLAAQEYRDSLHA